jgi:hypothetical protein
MNPYTRLVSSAISLISSQDGEVGDRELAFGATFVVAVVSVLFFFAVFSFTAAFFPELARIGREIGKWASLLAAVVIWLLQFPSVLRTATAISEGRCLRIPKSYALWSIVAALCAFLASIGATLSTT